MVNPALESAIEAMSLEERLEQVECIERKVESEPIELTEAEKLLIRSRAADLKAGVSHR